MNAKQLKDSILQYAMQGRLVPQNPNAEPASELIKRIKFEKELLVVQKVIKKEKDLPKITEDEIPFEIPSSWEWVRLGDIAVFINGDRGKNYPSKQYWISEGVPFINAGALGDKRLNNNLNYISEERFSLLKNGFVKYGDILYCLRGSLGKVTICDVDRGAVASSLVIIRPFEGVNREFILKVLQSFIGEIMIRRVENGTAQPNLSAANVKNYIIPFPPKEEQSRLLKKLAELEEKIEQFNILDEDFTALKLTFPIQLEKSILQYAMQGKLVEQVVTDEPASLLVERIKSEKERLVKEKIIKKEKALQEISDEEILFDIPRTWEWVRLGDLSSVTSGSTPLKSNPAYYKNGTIAWCTSTVTGRDIVDEPSDFITEQALKECSLTVYPKGTLIMAMYGQGKTRGQVAELGFDSAINQACAAIELIKKDLIDTAYLKICLMYVYNSIREKSVGGAQPNLNLLKVKSILIPVPPLAEQKRIIEKYKEVKNITDKL